MRVGLFTDTYFPQVSGVATSIRTLKEELEKEGHEVYIFTTTDKHVKRFEDPTIIRLPSVPFVSFTDRRVVYRGLISSYKIAKEYHLDIIHTQTEFSLGLLGKMVGKALRIPVVHTYHTQYEDYVSYIANGKIIRPSMVKPLLRGYLKDLDGVICPSRIVLNLLEGYEVTIPKRVIPTGIALENYVREDIKKEDVAALRKELAISDDETILLSLSRVSYEKNIQAIIHQLPAVLSENSRIKLVIVGDGPYLQALKELAVSLGVEDHVVFTGMIAHDQVGLYYKACDFFISASTSETQGLTYIESLASGKPIIAHGNPYLDDLITDKMFGTLYYAESELSDAIIDAILETPPMNQRLLDEKRYEISAQHFGKSVYTFYLDTLISRHNKETKKLSLYLNRTEKSSSIKLVQGAIHLPKRAAKATALTSVKVLKAPIKLVNAIRDFLD
ncbi:glycosyltransferase family 4 protein [Streptococcus equi subsp. zooepidemicus]|uniref:1,2-diacylglycerol 3-glucosyltransferase n=1 Tax=Streptococcus equi subsp. zooepidemicus (strain MGCS10565) TaxID=552526 RepID=B4U425_STREM|nr:glycosyltransferase family 4 protein [Streptococcus equi]ACG62742.1 1,2-diacylglycerol 3-glucosyltransferase [Streptococcus equi subsp. zooepidemicus MGCS10565]MCD3415814.1 glycosyltransferase family 4 protein [Streptococcus equi subsp. zooepidemicus]MDI5900710.1 glycosyltransferase family 4 protein [Streptococcus equi subsp. zooepidemicus]MDI5918317.1 glycosyltransferase family 4 protein [Streptococcus equi subsp. zooepidemicus]MDI5956479.1 glycosyltransferase family 4 protein [Streptococc